MSDTGNKLETSAEDPNTTTTSSEPRLVKDETELVTNPVGAEEEKKKEEEAAPPVSSKQRHLVFGFACADRLPLFTVKSRLVCQCMRFCKMLEHQALTSLIK